MAEEKKPIILIVEDNKVLVSTYQQMFLTVKELKAFQLVLYESAWLAMEWLNLLEDGEKPAAAILDWVMDGMNGLDLLDAMKKNPKWKDVPVLMVTSTGQRAKVALACTMGVDDYLLKPIQVKILVKKLQNLLSKSAPLPNPAGVHETGPA
jgi:DNA-binding response OmpR family regulator